MSYKPAFVFLAVALALAACQGSDKTPAVADNVAAIPAVKKPAPAAGPSGGPGILLAAWAGGGVVGSMDGDDLAKDRQAEKRAYTALIGQKITWNNPDTGNSGILSPLRDFYAPDGAYCREFQQSVALGGQQRQGSAKACQQADGSWKIAR